MDTLKTGFIVVLLLAVLYGVYVVLNKDQTPPTAEIAWHQQQAEKELQIEIGSPTDPGTSASTPTAGRAAEPGAFPKLGTTAIPTKGAELGIPSVIKAELSPSEENGSAKSEFPSEPASKPIAPSDTTQIPSSPSLSPSFVKSRSTSETTGPGVSAPSLLTVGPTTQPQSATDKSAGGTNKSNGLTSLPSLREPITRPSAAKMASDLVKPETTTAEPAANTLPADVAPPLSAETVASAEVPVNSKLDSTSPVDSAPVPGTSVTAEGEFEATKREALAEIAEEKWYPALFLLSRFYNNPELSSQQQQELIDLLDPLAAKVLYSQEHLVTDAHEVRRGETLAQIAEANQVPPELLTNINGIENPNLLVPGTKLKVVRGPFRAEVDLQKSELTVFAGQLYAGRFPISMGKDPAPEPGDYRVLEKQPGRVYYAGGGQTIAADDPQNPYGRVWIGIGKELAIHGSPERGEAGAMGCISLSPLDALDVYSILSSGSSVTIRK